nr:MAG TPA: hypothetical protein [Caudoviricetes sp.]
MIEAHRRSCRIIHFTLQTCTIWQSVTRVAVGTCHGGG